MIFKNKVFQRKIANKQKKPVTSKKIGMTADEVGIQQYSLLHISMYSFIVFGVVV